MSKTKSTKTSRLTILLVLIAVAAGVAFSAFSGERSAAKSSNKGDKISHAMRERLAGASANAEIVTVILRLKEKPKGELKTLLKRNGVKVKGEFEEFSSIVVELPASVVEELATFDEVEVATPDQDIRSFGFVEGATGAREMRLENGNSGLKGKDMNIAILDSGIDKDHHGVGDIAFQKDFTGENRTDDPFGHGTHVASLATAPAHIAHGAYTGLAPDAKIINLRVLDSQGIGKASNVLKALQWIF